MRDEYGKNLKEGEIPSPRTLKNKKKIIPSAGGRMNMLRKLNTTISSKNLADEL